MPKTAKRESMKPAEREGATPGKVVAYMVGDCTCKIIEAPSIYNEKAVEIEYCATHAAAPELLEALKNAMERIKALDEDWDFNQALYRRREGYR